MRLCWAQVSSYPIHNVSVFHSAHLKDQSTDNDGAKTDTEIVKVASLSAIFESQRRFMSVVMPASLLITLRQF